MMNFYNSALKRLMTQFFKMGEESEETVSQRWYANGQRNPGKMLPTVSRVGTSRPGHGCSQERTRLRARPARMRGHAAQVPRKAVPQLFRR